MMTEFDILAEAGSIFDKEIEALQRTKAALGEDFENIARLILNCQGKVILTGMGKPASSISSTLLLNSYPWQRPDAPACPKMGYNCRFRIC